MPLDPNLPESGGVLAHEGGASYPRFVFGGVFLPWQNPSWALRGVSAEIGKRARGSLTLIGGRHPQYAVDEGIYTSLFEELSQADHVSVVPMQAYENFITRLKNAHVALDVMEWNLERQMAVTIRSTTYLWAGLPVIYNNYADIGELIRQYDAGWCIEPGNEAALLETLTEVFENIELVKQKSRNATRLAREVFSWDRAVKPILEILGDGRPRRELEHDIVLDGPDAADFLVYQDCPLEQRFLCRVNGLSRVDCRVATHGASGRGKLRLRLYEYSDASTDYQPARYASAKTLRAEKEQDAGLVSNNEWTVFEFPRIADSAGKTYLFSIEVEEPKATSTIHPYVFRAEPYPLQGLYHGGKRAFHASMCIRTICSLEEQRAV